MEFIRILAICAVCLLAIIPIGYVFIRIMEWTETPSKSAPLWSDEPPYIAGATVTHINGHEARIKLQNGRVYTFGMTRIGQAYYVKPNGETVYANPAAVKFGKEPNADLMEHFRRYEAKR